MKYLYINKYWELNKEYNIDKLLFLMIDRPSEINIHNDDFLWKNNKKQYHRNYDLPSYVFIYHDGSCNLHWRLNSELYREKSKPT